MCKACREQIGEAFEIYSDSLKVQSDQLAADGHIVEAIALSKASIAALNVVMTLQMRQAASLNRELEQEG